MVMSSLAFDAASITSNQNVAEINEIRESLEKLAKGWKEGESMETVIMGLRHSEKMVRLVLFCNSLTH